MTAATEAPVIPGSPADLAPALGSAALLALQAVARQQGWGLLSKDAADGHYLGANATMAAWLRQAEAALAGRSDADVFDPATATLLRAADHTALAQPAALTSEHRLDLHGERREFTVLRIVERHATGIWLHCLWQDSAPQRQREQQLRVALDQLEQQQRANQTLRHELSDQSLRDQASGLNTRVHFDDQMRRELDLSTREHREFALVYMSLDPFSAQVRDQGARAQERIFEAMGRLLRGNTRAMDASCRIDDRRFAVLLSGVGLATAHSRMEGLRRQCATQIVMLDGVELGFTVAMGVASFPHTAHGQDELIAACGAALDEAQRRGGNTVALASIRFEPS